MINNTISKVLEPKVEKYLVERLTVLDDSFNTLQYWANCLLLNIQGISEKRAWGYALDLDSQDSYEDWGGTLEQEEPHHQQLLR